MSQNAPRRSELQKLVQNELPPYWAISKFTVGEPEKNVTGDKNRQIFRAELQIATRENLYAPLEQVGPFQLVVDTLAREDTVDLHAVIDLTWQSGAWKSGISLSHDTQAFGLPLKRFDLPPLIVGSPEAEKKLKQVSDARLIEEAATLGRQSAKALERVRETGRKQQDALKQQIAADLRAEREHAAAELLKIVTEHAKTRGELIVRQRQQISELETGLAVERQALARQVEMATDIKQNQNALARLLGGIALADKAALATFQKMREDRIAQLDKLPKNWHGQVNCTAKEDPNLRFDRRVELQFDEVLSNGFRASLWVNRGSQYDNATPAEVVLVSDVLTPPLKFRFVAPHAIKLRDPVPPAFVLSLAEDGTLEGDQPMQARINRKDREVQCSFSLSS
ncbi:hypothetical protein RXV86_09895 [Alisedimentitalea sp. MJ-SS2]|uniref:hypothetical protein n=1 Tax=Aliisedimentitalea sp. MJ-SS2 TaxID=3049795 RepID=UPI0029103879|nr:hypothetical protein [Alisedimentitalea sp. MJ-SS2]MDU8927694.1 hypothetical protein [Alisedimentitalea sp. MJ-SS2]